LGGAPDGVVRASLVHYNTVGEIARFREALIETIRVTSRGAGTG
jgi:selenocysteine lyase/cysteine desulfurase